MLLFVKYNGRVGRVLNKGYNGKYQVIFSDGLVRALEKSDLFFIKPKKRIKYLRTKLNILRVESKAKKLLTSFFKRETEDFTKQLLRAKTTSERRKIFAKNNSLLQLDGKSRSIAVKVNNVVAREQKRLFYESINRVYGINIHDLVENEDITRVLSDSISVSVDRIKSIPKDYHQELKRCIYNNALDNKKVVDLIKTRFSKYYHRAEFIARDQAGSLVGDLQKARMEAAGIDEAIWETSHDSRVRKNHADNNGKKFKISEGIKGEIPGKPINCRCIMIAVL